MGYSAKSKILEEIIVELKKKNIDIPEAVLSDLKAARTLLQVEKATPQGHSETEPKIDRYLGNVEMYVVSEADRVFAPETVEKWISRLNAANCGSCCPPEMHEQEQSRFVTGVPRNQKWVRIQPMEGLPAEKIMQMATEAGLSVKQEANQNLVVYGAPETLREFIKKITQTVRTIEKKTLHL